MNVNLTAFIDSLGVCIAHFLISFPQFISDVIKTSSKIIRGVPTLRISVSGVPQNLFGNLKILPGIGSLEKLFGKLQIILEYYIIYLGLASNFVLISGDVSFCLSMVNYKL